MGKKSIRENKNIYQITRENCGLTRDKASDLMEFMSADRIEKIESEKSMPHPDEILALAKCYKKPSLSNYYCSNECPIGQIYVPELKQKDLSQIALELLSEINQLYSRRERLIEITVDGQITEDEYDDFLQIQKQLSFIANTSNTLRLWVETKIAEGVLEEAPFIEM